MSPTGMAQPAPAEPMENGSAAEHAEEQAAAEALPAGLPRVQTEGAAFSTPEKDQLSSPHLMAGIKGQVLLMMIHLCSMHTHCFDSPSHCRSLRCARIPPFVSHSLSFATCPGIDHTHSQGK